ncbi:MAG: hypothetical protein ACI83Q_000782 [Colwellia polaris]|jgi:hypothetical protein
MLTFMARFAQIQNRLADLLETKFIPGEKDQITQYIYNTSENILEMHNSGRYRERDYHLLRLAIFAKHLEEVEEERNEVFEEFRSELKSQTHNEYFGTRFEVDIAASLIRKDIDFDHPDPPDFDIVNRDCVIECTTSHFSGGDRTPEEKIKQAIESKSGKSYFDSSNALFIDITNIYFAMAQREKEYSQEYIEEQVEERLDVFNHDIGSVILFTYVVDRSASPPGLHHSYIRVDNSSAEADLTAFLDSHWPKEGEHVPETYFPSEP